MTLSKQQKFDMIRDVELRLAKEELAEQYLKNVQAVENSDKPLRTLKELVQKNEQPAQEVNVPEHDATVGKALYEEEIPDFEVMAKIQRDAGYQTSEEKELMEQSEIATKTPSTKSGLDSKTQWEFIGLETLAMRDAGKQDIDVQEHFENAQAMSANHDMGMER